MYVYMYVCTYVFTYIRVGMYVYMYVCTYVCILHIQPYYRFCPDILSLVCDSLSKNGCGSPNYTVLVISFCSFTSLYLIQRKSVLYKVKSKSRFIQ
jgi:hypothetical protein